MEQNPTPEPSIIDQLREEQPFTPPEPERQEAGNPPLHNGLNDHGNGRLG